jgi:hypothetical protein
MNNFSAISDVFCCLQINCKISFSHSERGDSLKSDFVIALRLKAFLEHLHYFVIEKVTFAVDLNDAINDASWSRIFSLES